MSLCSKHKPILIAMQDAQRRDKRLFNALNRETIKDRKAIKRVYGMIQYRQCDLANVMRRMGYECAMCQFTGLPSSTVEHLIRNQKVVGSSPAVGS